MLKQLLGPNADDYFYSVPAPAPPATRRRRQAEEPSDAATAAPAVVKGNITATDAPESPAVAQQEPAAEEKVEETEKDEKQSAKEKVSR